MLFNSTMILNLSHIPYGINQRESSTCANALNLLVTGGKSKSMYDTDVPSDTAILL